MWSIKKATTVIATRTFYYRCKYAFSFTKHKVKANILYETLSVNKKLQHEFFSLFQIYTCSWKNVAGCKFCWWACTFLRTEAFVVYRPVSVHWPGIFFKVIKIFLVVVQWVKNIIFHFNVLNGFNFSILPYKNNSQLLCYSSSKQNIMYVSICLVCCWKLHYNIYL